MPPAATTRAGVVATQLRPRKGAESALVAPTVVELGEVPGEVDNAVLASDGALWLTVTKPETDLSPSQETVLRYDRDGQVTLRRTFKSGFTYLQNPILAAANNGAVIVAGATSEESEKQPTGMAGVQLVEVTSTGYLLCLKADGTECFSEPRTPLDVAAMVVTPDGAPILLQQQDTSNSTQFQFDVDVSFHTLRGSFLGRQLLAENERVQGSGAAISGGGLVVVTATAMPESTSSAHARVTSLELTGGERWRRGVHGIVGDGTDSGPRVLASDTGGVVVVATCIGRVRLESGASAAQEPAEVIMDPAPAASLAEPPDDLCVWSYTREGSLLWSKRHFLGYRGSLMDVARHANGDVWVNLFRFGPSQTTLARLSPDGALRARGPIEARLDELNNGFDFVKSRDGLGGVVGRRADGRWIWLRFPGSSKTPTGS